MQLTRRETLAFGLGAATVALLPFQVNAAADDAIAAFTGGADMADTGVTLTAPEIAENGNTVPISVDAPVRFRSWFLRPATRHPALQHSTLALSQALIRPRPGFVWRARRT